MTEQEAIEIAIHCLGVLAEQEVCEECPVYAEGGIVCREVARTAISALKEIRLYKDNGLCLIPEDVYSRQCSELDAYKEIGTVEECREAVEKQKPKKSNCTGMDEQDCYICPNCGADIGDIDGYFLRDNYCRECGQAIQWDENLEEKI